MTPALAAACLASAAVVVCFPARRVAWRLRTLAPPAAVRPHTSDPTGRSRMSAWAGLVRPGLVITTAVAAGVLGGWPALVVGVGVGLLVERAVRQLEPGAVRAQRRRASADVPFAVDLIAAALRAGAPVSTAVAAVGAALDGPLGDRLTRVARALNLGADPDEAWAHLGDAVGAARIGAAAMRSSESGAALARAFERLAAELREQRVLAAEAAARRAGVLAVLPLGLCFLPAFVLAGLVPVIVALLGAVI